MTDSLIPKIAINEYRLPALLSSSSSSSSVSPLPSWNLGWRGGRGGGGGGGGCHSVDEFVCMWSFSHHTGHCILTSDITSFLMFHYAGCHCAG